MFLFILHVQMKAAASPFQFTHDRPPWDTSNINAPELLTAPEHSEARRAVRKSSVMPGKAKQRWQSSPAKFPGEL